MLSSHKTQQRKLGGFHEFVDVNEHDELKGGFSIAIFCLALQELPSKIQPVFKIIENGSYTEVVQKLEGEDCDVVAGDITITSNRTKYADFTIPYMSTEIYMLVPAVPKLNQSPRTVTEPFTVGLWFAILCACVVTGGIIGYMEFRKENPYFYNVPLHRAPLRIIWFPVWKIFNPEGT
ncbi:hypothetical protein L1987_29780 [Smallanthus sonchifolius]|uniref:Uncharacterized protein n=1 Tax=Smallanthus sonchifolius TaxID=185202 RepID=A0ACB9I0F1_9ASTR|nr:hypothetical protein L1987_29780 [Smallanthus sonchifolius]